MERESTESSLRETVLRVAYAISKGGEEQVGATEGLDTNESRTTILEFISDEGFSKELTSALFPVEKEEGLDRITALEKFQRAIGIGDLSKEIVSLLWAYLLASQECDRVLGELLVRHVLQHLEPLAAALRTVEVPPEVLGPWLCSLRRKMGNDFAAGQIYRIVDSVIERSIEDALRILEGIQVDDEVGTRDIHSAFLGKLRTVQRSAGLGERTERLTAVDTFSRQSRDPNTSISYITSWNETAWGGQITVKDCDLLLEQFWSEPPEIRETLVWTLARILRADTDDEQIKELIIDALANSASSEATDVEKQAIIEASTHLLEQGEFNGDEWLVSILPIPATAEWAWMQIENYLVKRGQSDNEQFESLFIQIAERSAEEWMGYIQGQLGRSILHGQISGSLLSQLTSKLLVSRKRSVRKVGFTIFEASSDLLPASCVGAWSESDFSLALMEARREHMQGATGARYYVSLAQGVEKRSSGFQELLRGEMEHFASNYGKSCRDYFEEGKSDFKILETVMANVDHEYEEFKAGLPSPARHMQVLGFRKAQQLHLRTFGRGVAEGVKKNSLIEFLCGRPHLLTYGRNFRIYRDGQLGKSSGLHQSSTSVEIPIGEFSDPEYAAIRRLEASVEIARICGEEADSE